MSSLDRSLTLSFTAVVLALMGLFLAVAALLSFQIQEKRQGFLAAALAHSVSESVNRVNAYQMRGLVRDLTDRVPGLGYIAVADREGTVLAHSIPQFAGRSLKEIGQSAGDRSDLVWRGVHYLQLALPLLGGLDQGNVGTILVGVSIDDLRRDQGQFLGALTLLTVIGTLAAMVAVFLLSRRFGGRVQILARQLQGVLETTPMGIAIFDEQGRILQKSRSFSALADSPEARFPGVLASRLSPFEFHRLELQTAQVRSKGTPTIDEWTIGSETWQLTQFPVGQGQTGVVAQDLTQRVHIERELFESRLQLDQIIEKSPVGISITDLTTGEILRTNECFQRVYGYTQEQIPTLERFFEVAYPDPGYRLELRDEWAGSVALSIQTGAPIAPMEVRFTCADGSVRTVVISTATVGSLSVVTFVDRTDQKLAEGAIIELNRSLEEKVRARTEELELTFRELADSEKLAALGQLAAGMAHELNTPLGAIQAASRFNLDFLQGPLFKALEFLSSLNREEFAFLLDLMKKNSALSESQANGPDRASRRKLQASMEAKGLAPDEDLAEYLIELGLTDDLDRFAGSPRLVRILVQCQEFLTVFRMTHIVTEGAQKASYVVDALRSYLNRGDEGELTRFPIAEQMETILTLFQHKVRSGIEIVRDFDPEASVIGDRQRLNQVWINLIHNALQSMEFQGRLRLTVRREADKIRIEVGDSGPGIPEGIRDRIFDPYFTTKKHGEGLGLGLDLCLKILSSHHGTISFESRPGDTVFRVWLPASS